jgi:hypothetical protein
MSNATKNVTKLATFFAANVRADDSTDNSVALQAALNAANAAGGGVVTLPPGNIRYATTLTLDGGVHLEGQGAQNTVLKYSGAAQAIVQSTPGTRIYGVGVRSLKLQDIGTGTYGLDLNSVSSSTFDDLLIDGFSVNAVRLQGANGFCVYNRFTNVTAQNCTTGFQLGAAGSNSNSFIACRSNVCTTGWNILDSNQTQLIGCQIESGTTGVRITSSASALADRTTIIGCRFENISAGNVVIMSTNVRETFLMGNHHVTGEVVDAGLRTQAIDMFGTTGPNLKLVSAAAAAATGAFEFERTVSGGASLPALVVRDSNTGAGTPVTIQAETGRSTGSFFKGVRGGTAYFEAYANGALGIADGITAPGTVAGMAQLYVDTADGDLKVKFGDGTVKTIVVDT